MESIGRVLKRFVILINEAKKTISSIGAYRISVNTGLILTRKHELKISNIRKRKTYFSKI